MKILAALFIALSAMAQVPTCAVAPGFPQEGKLRQYDSETLYEYMNGNSEGYFLYSFAKMQGVTCKKGDISVVIDISEFKNEEFAYGMFTGNLDPRQATEAIGANGQVTPRKAIFVKGKYFAEIAVEPEGEHTAFLKKAAADLEKLIPGSTSAPAPLGWFPKEKLQPGSPRLVPQSVLGLRMLKSGYLALYEQGKAFVVTEESPAAATALFAKLKERFTPAGEAKAGEESFVAEDRYLGRIVMFRKGARVAGWTNVPAGTDLAPLASRLATVMP